MDISEVAGLLVVVTALSLAIGINYTTREKMTEIGPLEAMAERR